MRVLTCLCTALLLSSPPLWAAPVYKWKDANGVTQYSQQPPAGKAYETREQARPAPADAARPAAAVDPQVPAQCATARANLALLAGGGPVLQDLDGDGRAETPLDDAQRANHRGLAEAAVKAWCPPGN